MRTTLELDENILRAAQLSASEQGQALAELIEAAVRNYLGLGDSEATQVSEDTVDDSWSGASNELLDGLVMRNKGKGRAAAVKLADSKRALGAGENAKGGGPAALSYAGSIDDDADLSLRVEEMLAASWPKG